MAVIGSQQKMFLGCVEISKQGAQQSLLQE